MFEIYHVKETGAVKHLGRFDLSDKVYSSHGHPVDCMHPVQRLLLPLWTFNCAFGTLEETTELYRQRVESLRKGDDVFPLTVREGRRLATTQGDCLRAFPSRTLSADAPVSNPSTGYE